MIKRKKFKSEGIVFDIEKLSYDVIIYNIIRFLDIRINIDKRTNLLCIHNQSHIQRIYGRFKTDPNKKAYQLWTYFVFESLYFISCSII